MNDWTTISANVLMARCDTLATFSEEPERLTRRFATPAMAHAHEAVIAWMRAAGMSVRRDQIGNLRGRYEADRPNAPTLLLGSHLDSVRDAGKYDGPLGVLVALAVVQHLHDQQRRLPFAVEVLGFADEEGVRYHTTYLGSKALAGILSEATLAQRDADGITMADAIRAFGGDPTRIVEDRRARDDLLGYCEVHIEQGPVLEAQDLPVGVVTAIAGQHRIVVNFTGVAGHAGTVPMDLRQDALCAAAELTLAAEALAHQTPGLVATVGQITAQPGATNVIPGLVTMSLDVRHQDDAVLAKAIQRLHAQAQQLAERRRVTCDWQIVQTTAAVACAPALTALLGQAVVSRGYALRELPSGAGHDAAVMSQMTAAAMLFVRCKGGISHNPAESVNVADVAVTIDVLDEFVHLLASRAEAESRTKNQEPKNQSSSS